jgi:hypothetical protein
MSENPMLMEIQQVADECKPVRDPATGRFLTGNDAARNPNGSPGKRVGAYLRRRLEEMNEMGSAALERMTTNLIAIAEDPNPKTRKEAIWAWNALFDRAYGVPSKSDEELQAMRDSGVQIAIVQLPGQPTQIATSRPKALLVPEYDEHSPLDPTE